LAKALAGSSVSQDDAGQAISIESNSTGPSTSSSNKALKTPEPTGSPRIDGPHSRRTTFFIKSSSFVSKGASLLGIANFGFCAAPSHLWGKPWFSIRTEKMRETKTCEMVKALAASLRGFPHDSILEHDHFRFRQSREQEHIKVMLNSDQNLPACKAFLQRYSAHLFAYVCLQVDVTISSISYTCKSYAPLV
jgi:hypothetical protein